MQEKEETEEFGGNQVIKGENLGSDQTENQMSETHNHSPNPEKEITKLTKGLNFGHF